MNMSQLPIADTAAFHFTVKDASENAAIYAHVYMPTSSILTVRQKQITEADYYMLSHLPFAHHLHGNSHLEESVKPLVSLHYHSYEKV